jgi:methylglutaconyl-CoA hydratase
MSFVLYEIKDRIAYITLNRPEKRNALNSELVTLLKKAFTEAENDDEVKVIILKAAGDNFCAGADLEYLRSLQQNTYEENLQDSHHLMELFKMIYSLKKVVIAQVRGHAVAGGCGLVSVCDFAFAVPDANFGYSEVKIGFIPAIVMVYLLRKIGEAKAKELLLSGNFIDADKALRYGLVFEVVSEEHLEQSVYDFARKLCRSNSGKSMEMIKKMITEIPSMAFNDALQYGARMNAEARSSEDCKKGIDSFLNKRKIEW